MPFATVGVPALQQPPDQLLHLRDVLCRAREVVRRQPVQGRHLGQEGRHVPVAEGQVVLAQLAGTAQEIVVDIGQILDVDDVMAQVLQVPMQDVERKVREGMPQVTGVVRRHAAHVEAHRALAEWAEGERLAAKRVVQAEGHGRDSRRGSSDLFGPGSDE